MGQGGGSVSSCLSFLVQELSVLVSGSGLAGHFGDSGLPALYPLFFHHEPSGRGRKEL